MIQASVADKGRIDLRHHIDIRSEAGEILYVLHFEDAVPVAPPPDRTRLRPVSPSLQPRGTAAFSIESKTGRVIFILPCIHAFVTRTKD